MKTTLKLDILKADAQSGENLDEFIKLTEEYFRENWPENLPLQELAQGALSRRRPPAVDCQGRRQDRGPGQFLQPRP
jgi:hypothetical protein